MHPVVTRSLVWIAPSDASPTGSRSRRYAHSLDKPPPRHAPLGDAGFAGARWASRFGIGDARDYDVRVFSPGSPSARSVRADYTMLRSPVAPAAASLALRNVTFHGFANPFARLCV